jgi:hypothetical protein
MKQAGKNIDMGMFANRTFTNTLSDIEAAKMGASLRGGSGHALMPEWMRDWKARWEAGVSGGDNLVAGHTFMANAALDANDLHGARQSLHLALRAKGGASDELKELQRRIETLEQTDNVKANVNRIEQRSKNEEQERRDTVARHAATAAVLMGGGNKIGPMGQEAINRVLEATHGDARAAQIEKTAKFAKWAKEQGMDFETAMAGRKAGEAIFGSDTAKKIALAITEGMQDAQTMIGRKATIGEKLLGGKDQPGTLAPAMRDLLGGALGPTFGPAAAQFLGFGDEKAKAIKARHVDEIQKRERRDTIVTNEYFQGLAARQQAGHKNDAEKAQIDQAKDTKALLEVSKRLLNAWINLKVFTTM